MNRIVLSDRYDVDRIIKEEKELWVINILSLLGVVEDDLNNMAQDALNKYNIEVWDHLNNNDVEIKHNNILVAKWYNPVLLPKYDDKKTIYYEIYLDYDSIFDNTINSDDEEK